MHDVATRVLGALLFASTAALLTSIGGAGAMASPLTVPLMYLFVKVHPTRPFRVAGIIIGGLTAFEGGLGLGYVILNWTNPGSMIIGLALMALVMVAFIAVPAKPNAAARL